MTSSVEVAAGEVAALLAVGFAGAADLTAEALETDFVALALSGLADVVFFPELAPVGFPALGFPVVAVGLGLASDTFLEVFAPVGFGTPLAFVGTFAEALAVTEVLTTLAFATLDFGRLEASEFAAPLLQTVSNTQFLRQRTRLTLSSQYNSC